MVTRSARTMFGLLGCDRIESFPSLHMESIAGQLVADACFPTNIVVRTGFIYRTIRFENDDCPLHCFPHRRRRNWNLSILRYIAIRPDLVIAPTYSLGLNFYYRTFMVIEW